MTATSFSTQGIGLRCGIITSIAMIAYFFVVNFLNLQDIVIARFASNIFILLAVVLAIRTLRRKHQSQVPYFSGLTIGFLVGLIGSGLFAAFIFIDAKVINPDYAAILESQDYYGLRLPPLMLAGAITILGTAIGTMTGYILMMAFDNSGGHTKN